MSNTDSGYRSGHFLRPGMKAFEVGVKHAMMADNVMEMLGVYPKKQKLMPPVPKKSYGKSSSSGRTTKRTASKTSSVVKKTILAMAATKRHEQNDSALAQVMTQNNIYSNNITSKLIFGTADNQRIGDEVYLTGIRVKGNYISAAAQNGYQCRIIVGWSGEEYNPTTFGSSGASTGLIAAEVFLPLTGGQYQTSAIINPKAFTVLYDRTLTINSNLEIVSEFQPFDFYVPLSKKFQYQAGGSIYGKTKNLYIVCTSSAIGGTPLTTNSGTVNVCTSLSYKNM